MHDVGLRRTLVRLPLAFIAHGSLGKSAGYDLIGRGLFPKPIKAGTVSPVVPSDELQAVIDARIAGQSDDQIKELVQRLHAARHEVRA